MSWYNYFEAEHKYDVVTPECIEESDYRHLEDIQVYWGRGKNSKLYPAKQVFYGTL